MRLVLASGNPGKIAELDALLESFGVCAISQRELGIEDPDETASTFVENALIKARHAARASGLPALADDSGLIVDALDGRPGLYSARYAGRHGDAAANVAKVLAELAGIAPARRSARFIALVVVVASPDDPAPLIAEGIWNGAIAEAPRGALGFGYDPIFVDPTLDRTAAEIDPATRHRISHRGRALADLATRWPAWRARIR